MSSFENIIPNNHSLNETVKFFENEIDEIFDENRDLYCDIIDPNHEIRHDIVTMGHFADTCSQLLATNAQQLPEISSTIYRSICFADQIADVSLPGRYTCPLSTYIQERLQETGSIDGIIKDTQEYLQHRDHLDSMISYYSPEIDLAHKYPHVVELFSGMFFMLAERSIGEQYVESSFNDISPEDITKST